jgi:hypothetical protein
MPHREPPKAPHEWSTPIVQELPRVIVLAGGSLEILREASGQAVASTENATSATIDAAMLVEAAAGITTEAGAPVQYDGMEMLSVAMHSEDARAYRFLAESEPQAAYVALSLKPDISPREKIKFEVRDALLREGRATKRIRDQVIRRAKELGLGTFTDRHAADWCRGWLKEFR